MVEHEHKKFVLKLLKKLDRENFALRLSNCEFCTTEVSWLGQKLSPIGITPIIKKTEAIVKLNPPKSLRLFWIIYGYH